jgi:hypothetical protein
MVSKCSTRKASKRPTVKGRNTSYRNQSLGIARSVNAHSMKIQVGLPQGGTDAQEMEGLHTKSRVKSNMMGIWDNMRLINVRPMHEG